jgi:hypothetical protein
MADGGSSDTRSPLNGSRTRFYPIRMSADRARVCFIFTRYSVVKVLLRYEPGSKKPLESGSWKHMGKARATDAACKGFYCQCS